MTFTAELGRYYVASISMRAVNIIAKNLVLKEQIGSDGEDELGKEIFVMWSLWSINLHPL